MLANTVANTAAGAMWSVSQASRALDVPLDWIRKQVRLGRVPVRKVWKGPHRVPVAPVSAWEELALRYRSGAIEQGTGLRYNPLRATVMTPIVYDGFRMVYGVEPVCVVCGVRIEPGALWRWLVPPIYQPGAADIPHLAIGCAIGHEGEVVEVGGVRWIVAPEGVVPKRMKEVRVVGG